MYYANKIAIDLQHWLKNKIIVGYADWFSSNTINKNGECTKCILVV